MKDKKSLVEGLRELTREDLKIELNDTEKKLLKKQMSGESPLRVKQNYVVGFMFSEDGNQVALIRKQKPAWQKGRLNGIGGKLEPGEIPGAAMIREFKEETGLGTSVEQWSYFARVDGSAFTIHCFTSIGYLPSLKTTEEEAIEICNVKDILSRSADFIDNTPWLILLAQDHLNDGRLAFVQVQYSGPELSKKTRDI